MTTVAPPLAFPAFGATAVAVTTDDRDLDAGVAAVTPTVGEVDPAGRQLRDDWDPGRLNAAGGSPVRVSPVLLDELEVAVRTARWPEDEGRRC